MFSKYFDPIKLRLALQQPSAIKEDDLFNLIYLLQSETEQIEIFAKLLLASDNEVIRSAVLKAAKWKRKRDWINKLFLMPPLYISDGDPERHGCLDHCSYCPWRNGNVPEDKLVRLSEEEVGVEASHLISLGYRGIELVGATDPKLLNAEYAARMVRATKNAGARNVGINFFPLRFVKDYKTLHEAGCDFAIVWQETYDRVVYETVHAHGPKSKMDYRLDAHDRALKGGIKTVGVAFLGGLADWRFDALATYVHAYYLRREYHANIIYGMPRKKHSVEDTAKQNVPEYSDKDYEYVGALFSLSMSHALPWFSTREEFDLSAKCVAGGGCLFTLDCSTQVGGYTKQDGFAQFPVHSRSFEQGTMWLKQLGFYPHVQLPW